MKLGVHREIGKDFFKRMLARIGDRNEISMSRKIQVAVVLGFLIFFIVYIFISHSERESERYRATFYDVFDTHTEMIGYGRSERTFSAEVEKLHEQLQYYHKLLDIYHEYEGMANLKTINDAAGIAPVKVDEKLIEFLLFGKEMYDLTQGETNIAMGSVLKIWHDYRQRGNEQPQKAELPTMKELEEAFCHTDMENLVIDEEASTVYLKDPKMSLDVGSVGKGYASEKVAQYAKEQGITNMLLNLGGNIRTIGVPKEGELWQLGIQNPDLSSEKTYIETIQIQEGSLVTSGSYQRYYIVDGKKYCHIIDKDTLMPAEYIVSVTILTEDTGLADVLSTAVFNMPIEQGKDFIDGLENVEAMWVLSDGSCVYSQGFSKYQG